jgi:hypothetical protein
MRNIIEGKGSKGEKVFYHGIQGVGHSKKDLLPGDKIEREDGKTEEIKGRKRFIPAGGLLLPADENVKDDDCFIVVESIVY